MVRRECGWDCCSHRGHAQVRLDHPEAVLERRHVAVGVAGVRAARAGGALHEHAQQAAVEPDRAHGVTAPRRAAQQRRPQPLVQPDGQAAPPTGRRGHLARGGCSCNNTVNPDIASHHKSLRITFLHLAMDKYAR